ncbi:MAG: YhbY family RNA-binding protein [Candidatus Helarchaeota archaeon]|nr:YhbY family RNA-binding protein [Candidatus Helarchaeota archaeon]
MSKIKKSAKEQRLQEIKLNSAQIIIGKNGLSENALITMKDRLKKEKIMKVKVLKTAPELKEMGRKDFAKLIVKKLNADLIEVRGFSFILQRKGYINLKQ